MKLKYEISRFRSITNKQSIELDSNKINAIIGINGSGKSNIIDAIRWFSDNDIKNIKSRKTKFNPESNLNLYLDEPEIIYDDCLEKTEKDIVVNKLKKINIEYNPENLHRHFGKYKDLFYKELNVTKNGLTDLAMIKEKIVLKFIDFWPSEIFFNIKEANFEFWEFNNTKTVEDAKKEIMNSSKKGLNKELRSLLCLAIDIWIEIEEIFKSKPNILFSSNLELDNNILFEYQIQTVKNKKTMDPTFRNILKMLGKDTIAELEQIIDLSTSDSNRSYIRTLKDKMHSKAEVVFKNIFKNFTIKLFPEIIIDDQMFQIIIQGNENRYYSNSVTAHESSGFKAFFWLIIMLEVSKNWKNDLYGRTILLLDEPDKSLHILLQYEIANYLKLNFTKESIYILMVTHSPFLIPSLNENIYIADMNERGETTMLLAENISNIRNSGIFPLMVLFHINKLSEELFLNKKNDSVRFYYVDKKDDKLNKKIEEFIEGTILNVFEYTIIKINNDEKKNIYEIGSNKMFSKYIYEIDELHNIVLPINIGDKKDLFLTDKVTEQIISADILKSMQ